jgi:hypothetical protein
VDKKKRHFNHEFNKDNYMQWLFICHFFCIIIVMYMDGIMTLELVGYVPIKIYLKKLEENFSMQEILTAL